MHCFHVPSEKKEKKKKNILYTQQEGHTSDMTLSASCWLASTTEIENDRFHSNANDVCDTSYVVYRSIYE